MIDNLDVEKGSLLIHSSVFSHFPSASYTSFLSATCHLPAPRHVLFTLPQYSSSFVFQILTIAVFFQFQTPSTSNDLSIFRYSCEFPGFIFDERVIFSLHGFSLLEPIRATNGLFKCVAFVISFVIYIRLQHS